ncbi:MAG: CocE/NonD family hydrolase, partial [Candidatus Acidiferrales bacterium]
MKHSSRISSSASKILAFHVVATLFLVFLLSARTTNAQTYQVTVERNVPAKMRDGVTLRADVYRPKAEGKFPVLLTRTPYDKQWEIEFALKAVPRGYVVIAQDTRGRYES